MSRRGLPLMRTAAVAALIAVGWVAVGVGLLTGGPAAHADEVYPRPSSGAVSISGKGYGHGHGMSQYGAYGAAQQGVGWADIVARYYPGTTRTGIGNPTIRVDVRGDVGNQMAFGAAAGLSASFGPDHTGASAMGTSGEGASRVVVFQVVAVTSTQLQVMYLTEAGFWYRWGPQTTQVNITNASSGSVIAWAAGGGTATYAGEYRAVMASGSVVPVAALPMESYVRGVVPRESSSSWPAAALSAQAVAARTYGAYFLGHPRASGWDICDTTSCQVFKGSGFAASTDAATSATAGVVLTYGGAPILAEFGASSGGWTADGGQPYLVAQADPWDTTSANPYRTWTASIPATTIESTWPSIGTYRQLRVTARDGAGDWGGRVVTVSLDGSAGSVSVSGDTLRGRLGLKSTYFTPVDTSRPISFPRDYSGDGRADLAWVQPGANGGQLMRAVGSGTGTFGSPEVMGAQGWSFPAAVFSAGDWDGDGVSDAITVGTDGMLLLWRGPTMSSGTQIGSDFRGYDLEFPVGDFNGDGRSDFFARRASDATLWMFSSTNGGGLTGPVQVTPPMGDKRDLFSPGDYDGDGATDLMAIEADGTIRLFSGNGSGGWLRFVDLGREWSGTTGWFGIGDTSGDGRPDIYFTLNDGTLRRLIGAGSSGFSSVSITSTGWPAGQRFLR